MAILTAIKAKKPDAIFFGGMDKPAPCCARWSNWAWLT
jgi:hypothetical protein